MAENDLTKENCMEMLRDAYKQLERYPKNQTSRWKRLLRSNPILAPGQEHWKRVGYCRIVQWNGRQ